MERIGIIGAMEAEVNGLIKCATDIESEELYGSVFYTATLLGKKVVIVQSGIGKVNASIVATLLKLVYGVDGILMLGIAGGINADKFSTIIASGFVQHDVAMPGAPDGHIDIVNKVVIEPCDKLSNLLTGEDTISGIIATGECFVADKDKARDISEKFEGVVAVDMESGAVAQVCARLEVPFAAAKSISDECSSEEYFKEESCKKSIEIVMKMLEKL